MSYPYERDNFDKTCNDCGAVFNVSVPGEEGCHESEEYYCPECHSEYKIKASNSPTVRLITPRTDGK